jgi:hypothetical protein
MRVRQQSATDTFVSETATMPNTGFFLLFYSAMELSGAGFCSTWRGWTLCPARARPFWIKRGACPLHDLKKV